MSYSKGFIRNKHMIFDSDKQKKETSLRNYTIHDQQESAKETPKSWMLSKRTQKDVNHGFSGKSSKDTGIDSVKISTPQQQTSSKYQTIENSSKNYVLKKKYGDEYKPCYEQKKQDQNKLSANRTLYNPTYKKYLSKQSQFEISSQDHQVTFQSAKIQSLKCLQNLQNTLQREISNVDSKLQAFRYKMNRSIMAQFKKLRDRIIESIDKIFKQSDKNIEKYMKIQEEILAGELLQVKEHLKQQHCKIQSMKEKLKGIGWRKVAGEIIASDINSKINCLVKQAQNLEVGYWQPIQISDAKLKPIQTQIKQLAKLTQ